MITTQENFHKKGYTEVIFISGEVTISGEELIVQNGSNTKF
jgi:hypothetical protein